MTDKPKSPWIPVRKPADKKPAGKKPARKKAPVEKLPEDKIAEEAPSGEKLQKVLARAGFGSRRQLEEWISAGRVQVNGKPAKLGDRVGAADKIVIDGKKLASQDKESTAQPVLLYNKPLGEICSRNDPEGRP